MSLREKQQIKLDTESATHAGMECQARSSYKYQLLQVWCGLLTVAMVVMAALITSIKPKSSEDEVSILKPDVSPTANTAAPLKSEGSSVSYIQLMWSSHHKSWQHSQRCNSCSLIQQGDSILCRKKGLYLIYAQVTFSTLSSTKELKSVILIRNARHGRDEQTLVEGTFPHASGSSVWVANIISLKEEDSISIKITGDFLFDISYWGAVEFR